MLGAIIGDIVGSRFVFNNHRSKEFDLFTEDCFATDDSIMTLAVAKAIMETEKTAGSRIGGMFAQWMFSDNPQPYHSFGNGAAMRISPAGFAARSEAEAISLSKTITSVTHDHEEGIKGAASTAVAIFMARQGCSKSDIRRKLINDYYPLNDTIDEIRSTYRFNEICQATVPQALTCFFESESFEDAIRTAISIGGDSDTIGAITGAIAEAYYGVPAGIREKALTYLDSGLRSIFDEWELFAGADRSEQKSVEVNDCSALLSEDGNQLAPGPINNLILCDEKTNYISVMVWAEVIDACLRISGQDLGKAAGYVSDDNEYEYFYDFDRENTKRLFALLTSDPQNLRQIFYQKFSGMNGCRYLREFYEAHGITYKFFHVKFEMIAASRQIGEG